MTHNLIELAKEGELPEEYAAEVYNFHIAESGAETFDMPLDEIVLKVNSETAQILEDLSISEGSFVYILPMEQAQNFTDSLYQDLGNEIRIYEINSIIQSENKLNEIITYDDQLKNLSYEILFVIRDEDIFYNSDDEDFFVEYELNSAESDRLHSEFFREMNLDEDDC